ncbi:MAG: pyridoxal phosphate-dependent aminotransferase [Planctomycetaceae bacterium]|nr:pyridoxal phosphate-dependent aminotransferase [Planctomycetaceae bacterium]
MKLPAFPLVQWFAAAEGRIDISLSHSDCEPLSVADVLKESQCGLPADFSLGYGTFAGREELRQSIAAQYTTIDKDDVQTFSGASEAIYTFMRTNLNPGDEVVIQTPIFNSLKATAHAIGCRIIEWRPANELTLQFDVSALDDLCREQTKLIVFNFPHNPSGQTISENELMSIVATARRSNSLIFSDEQFRLLELPDTPCLPAACDLYDRAVSVSGVSKTYGLGGLRIGWLATRNRDLLERAREYRYYTTEMTNTPCQLLAAQAMKQRDAILSRNHKRIVENLEQLRAFCLRHPARLKLHPPQAGTMTLVEQTTACTSTEFCQRLLDEQRVLLVPGAAMGLSDRLLRFGFGRDHFVDGLNRLEIFLKSISSE